MKSARPYPSKFSKALQYARKQRNLSQEDFGVISSRTYISTLERGLKSPTLTKVEDLASVMTLHPLTLLSLAYLKNQTFAEEQELFSLVSRQLDSLRKVS